MSQGCQSWKAFSFTEAHTTVKITLTIFQINVDNGNSGYNINFDGKTKQLDKEPKQSEICVPGEKDATFTKS